MATVVLLGAGATSGTLEKKAPTSAKFGKHLGESLPNWAKYYPNLSKVVSYLRPRWRNTTDDSWALHEVWTAIDNRAKLKDILDWMRLTLKFKRPRVPGQRIQIYKDILDWMRPTLKFKRPRVLGQRIQIYKENKDIWDEWDFAGFELRRAVARVYGETIEDEIQNAVNARGSVKQEIGKLKPGDCVVSFNYDVLDEKVLGKCHPSKWVRAHPWLDIANPGNAIVLCKPHGSLNWLQRVPGNGRRVQILPKPMREDDIDYKKGATLQPGIVGPVPFKSEIIVPEIQGSVNSFHELLVAQWSWAMSRISEAQELVIMGYGFPKEDLHARFLFEEAIANSGDKSGSIKVRLYEKKSCCEQVKKTIQCLFKLDPEQIEYKGEVRRQIDEG